ncbi:MAG: hypothetical protein K0S56_265 [Microvirga sp.]|jgi:hypothetical protein|nr:hypothetical protein [Microvirga sp.]
MRKTTPRKPALVDYLHLCLTWANRAWVLYRLYERLEPLAEVVKSLLGL